MKSSDVKKAVETCYRARRPFFLWGPPGVGKSDTLRQAAEELDVELRDVRATLLDPVDLRGLPMLKDVEVTPAYNEKLKDGSTHLVPPITVKQAHWATPDFLPYNMVSKGILFLDELNSAPQAVQAACYQLILDRRLGDYVLPDGWLVCAAGNRETDRAVTNRMPSALSNRLIHLHFDVDNNDWQRWALAADVMTEVIAFLRFRPALLHSFDATKNEKAFPTPRSWQFVSDLLKHSPRNGIEFEIIKGTVGEGAAAEFVGFLRIFRGLPNPDSVLMNPATAPVPDQTTKDGPATLWALCGALARKASEQTMPNLVAYANRLPDEFSVLLIRDSEQLCPDIRNTRAYIEWASKHASVLI